MLPPVKKKPSITIVGAGRLGRALGMALRNTGYRVEEIVSRDQKSSRRKARELAALLGARCATAEDARLDANIIWFCVSDREIAKAARTLAKASPDWKGKVALHSSGALRAAELGAWRRRGARIASVHPLMTFVHGSRPSLKGVPFAVEGDAAAVRVAEEIVRTLGGEPFPISPARKPAYHAWGAFASPLLVAALVAAEQAAKLAGVDPVQARRRMMPIIRQTVENYAKLGPAGAFSGPIVRGDAAVVRAHLKILRRSPEVLRAYLALAQIAVRYLPARNRNQLTKLLPGIGL
jgi:predicted short-subunit dehydrogenase-like oxidoreductase (DUF2520 family)